MLNEKRKRFCAEFIVDMNGSAAARRAGYSAKSSAVIAKELMEIPEVIEEIQRLNSERSQRTQVTADRVIKELAAIAFFDVRKLYTEDGQLVEPKHLDDESARAIASVEVSAESVVASDERVTTERVKKIRSNDKLKALELLGKHLSMFTDKLEIKQEQPQVLIYLPDNGNSAPATI